MFRVPRNPTGLNTHVFVHPICYEPQTPEAVQNITPPFLSSIIHKLLKPPQKKSIRKQMKHVKYNQAQYKLQNKNTSKTTRNTRKPIEKPENPRENP